MNENAQKWVDALRSGKYEQGHGQLRKGDRYCCLGVACDVYIQEMGGGEWIAGTRRTDDWWFANEKTGYDAVLPDIVREWLGLSKNAGEYVLDGQPRALTKLNDDYQMSFRNIAIIIESEPEGLFANERECQAVG